MAKLIVTLTQLGYGARLFLGAIRLDTPHSTDEISGFAQGDRIDIAELAGLVPNHAGLHFIGAESFSGHPGEVDTYTQHGDTYLAADLNGDMIAEFTVKIDGQHKIPFSDLLLH